MVAAIREKIVSVRLPGASATGVCAVESLTRIAGAFRTEPGQLDLRDLLSGEPPDNGAAAPAGRRPRRSSPSPTAQAEESTLPELLSQWLSFYGPLRRASITELLGLAEPRLDAALAGLAESQEVIIDLLTENAREVEVCDRENLEILLRMARRARRPSFRALPIDHLPLFLAAWQGITARGDSLNDLQERLDQLFGFPAPAEAWEKHLLPARLAPYYSAWLDSLMQTSGLMWFGCGKQKTSFAFADDLELFLNGRDGPIEGTAAEEELSTDRLAGLLSGRIGRYSLLEITRHAGMESGAVTEKLWKLAWQGRITNDAFATVRQGILTGFAPFPLQTPRSRSSRLGYNRWAASRPFSGNWYAIGAERIERDTIDDAELAKDRVRQLLRRYGILFREILAAELPQLQWAKVFRALRLMELSGELLAGYFFEGIPDAQFISPDAFRFLQEPLPEDAVYWLNAADPASLCGIRLEALKGALPGRIPSTHLVYRGSRPVMISRRNGGALEFMTPPDDPRLPDYLAFFKALLTREFSPEKMVAVETINGKPALESEYSGALREFGFARYHKGLELVRRY